jgi:glyoxylase-like metal-dependent hydrolase (beta-lactamase superfamily II)
MKEFLMRITNYGRYLIQLTRYPLLFPVNCYLVREDDGLTLIDTGLSGSAAAILNVARELGMSIQRIILTHAHGDHLGSLDALYQLLPEVEVLVSARDARFLAGDMSLDPSEPQMKLRGDYRTTTTRPNRLLYDGDQVGSLQVISTPGHTPGHIALFDARDGTLIAGDAFQTRAGVAVSGTVRWLFPFPALATWSRSLALASARKLHAWQPARLAIGHGEVLELPLAKMDHAIEVAARELGELQLHGA